MGETTNSNPLGPIRVSNVCLCVCWLVVRSFCLFLDYARERTSPVFFSSPICGFGIFGCTRKELSAIQQIVVISSFQLKEKVADFFCEVRSESENFCFVGVF